MFNQYFKAPVWQYDFLGNTLQDLAIALVAFAVFLLVFKIFQMIILSRLKKVAEKTKTDIDDAFIKIINSVHPPFYSFVAFYLALQFLAVAGIIEKVVNVVLIIWVLYQVIVAVQILIDYVVKKMAGGEERRTRAAISALSTVSKIILWSLGLLLILSNLGVDITALVAGLGIGGIAIAFALQNILGDLFSSFAIYFDKPFVEGDFIIVGKDMGVVKKVGIKTTRIQALQGEEIVISNQELTSARVQNFKKMEERRVVFAFGVLYETSYEKLKKIPQMVKDIIESMDKTRFDRAHFKSFGDSSLDFEVVYYVLSPDYNEYMDIHQEINLKIVEAFEKEKIDFAYPTRTIYMAKQ